ncbi:MAG: response regulator [Nitrospinae bacterium]|nr:response regulator [Nitrospinota bacterium]
MSKTNRILIVEDHKPSQDLASRILKLRNYSVSAANNGDDAIREMETHEFDLVLLDILLPGLSGMDVLKWIHRHRPKIPAIVISSLDKDGKVAKEAKSLGALDFIGKPVNYNDLLRKVDGALHNDPSPPLESLF